MLQATAKGSYHNLAALVSGLPEPGPAAAGATGLASGGALRGKSSLDKTSSDAKPTRLIIVSNQLPVRIKRGASGAWEFEWDEDALVAQAKEGVPAQPPLEVMYVGGLPVDVGVDEQEAVALELKRLYRCCPVYIDKDVKDKFYQGFCKQQLWPLFHYILPMTPSSSGRFDSELWQAYVKANKCFADKVVEESASDCDFVWIHDYHLLVLPSLLRKRFNRIRAGLFLHSPFPSSEIFRTFPKREELLRSLLNADLIGFHTFDYARHFLSCCSRMLGLEHETSRGSITIDYYGRAVGIKIMPTGVNPSRYLSGFSWDDFKWRRGELLAQFAGLTVLVGVDDMDVFKGIELKLQAFERLLDHHPDWRGKAVLVQVTNPPRSSGKDVAELHAYVKELVGRINRKYGRPARGGAGGLGAVAGAGGGGAGGGGGSPARAAGHTTEGAGGEGGYMPVHYLERHVPLHERMAYYSVADCAVVTATRDGMNLVPYEYVACRQGPYSDTDTSPKDSMLVVSEFVGCSPSLSGAIRVNPWSVESLADGLFAALRLPLEHRRVRHDKHWRYVSQHTVAYWSTSYITELQRVTRNHVAMKCYGLGLGLDTFRLVALDANFRRLDEGGVALAYAQSSQRALFLDYDGTLTSSAGSGGPTSGSASHHRLTHLAPDEQVLAVLRGLCADPRNTVVLFSGRTKTEMSAWFEAVPRLGLVAENGFYTRPAGSDAWATKEAHNDSWKKIVLPILQQYQESTDGSSIEVKESALVWHYGDADPDFGSWQAKELLDHLEGVLINQPVQLVGGNAAVEIQPQGVSKGQAVERMLAALFDKAPAAAAAAAAATSAATADGSSGSGAIGGQDGAAAADSPPPLMGKLSAGASRPPLPGGAHGHLHRTLHGAVSAGAAAGGGGGPDFVLCIGDGRSDEDMFTSLEAMRSTPRLMTTEVYAVTVGQKPSRAPFYLNDPGEVLHLLARMVGIQLPHAESYP